MVMSIGKEEYRFAHQNITMAYQLLSALPLQEILAAQQRAHTIGPMLDPTMYRDKMQAMVEDESLFRAALTFVNTIKDLLDKAEEKKARRA